MIRRFLATALLLSASCSLAAGVSGAQAASATLTKRQAAALARAINLTAADLPGFKAAATHEHEAPAEERSEGQLSRCAGAQGPRDQLAEASSAEFGREDKGAAQSVESSVSVERTSTQAVAELRAVRSARGHQCLVRNIDRLLKAKAHRGASISPVSISAGSPSVPGAAGSFAWRIQTAVTYRGVRIPFFMDFVGFVYGPAEVTLFSFGLPAPLPAATQARLLALLVARAKAQSV